MLYIWHCGRRPDLVKVLEQLPFDGQILIFTGPILTKLAWIVHLNILMYMYLTRRGYTKDMPVPILLNFFNKICFNYEPGKLHY